MFRFATVPAALALLTLSSAAAAASNADNLLLNPSAEQGQGDQPSVWEQAAVPAQDLRMSRTSDAARTGQVSLTIANEHQYGKQVSNNWMQTLQDVPHGARLRLRAAIRTRDAEAANVCLQCWDVTGSDLLAFASTPVFRGDQDWIEVNATPLIVPAETAQIVVRAALTGKGQVWFDDLQVRVEPPNAPATNAAASATQRTTEPSVAAPALPADLPGQLVQAIPISRDCMVLAYLPGWDHGNVDNVAVANNDGGVRALLAWEPISSDLLEPENRRAYLAVFSRQTTAVDDSGDLEISACPLLGDWPEKTSWQTQPKFDPSHTATAKFVAGNGWKLFDVTPLLRDGRLANRNGIVLKFSDEQQTADDWSGYALVTREGLGEWENRHPQLLIVEIDAPAGE